MGLEPPPLFFWPQINKIMLVKVQIFLPKMVEILAKLRVRPLLFRNFWIQIWNVFIISLGDVSNPTHFMWCHSFWQPASGNHWLMSPHIDSTAILITTFTVIWACEVIMEIGIIIASCDAINVEPVAGTIWSSAFHHRNAIFQIFKTQYEEKIVSSSEAVPGILEMGEAVPSLILVFKRGFRHQNVLFLLYFRNFLTKGGWVQTPGPWRWCSSGSPSCRALCLCLWACP